MRKKRIVLVLFLIVAMIGSTAVAYGDSLSVSTNSIAVSMEDKTVAVIGESYKLSNGSTVPYSILYKGTTYLPVRKIAELVGKNVDYDATTHTAKIKGSSSTVLVKASNATVKNGQKVTLNIALNAVNVEVDGKTVATKGQSYRLANGGTVPYSLIYEGTTYLPMRKVAEIVGKDVGYLAESKTAVIQDKVSYYKGHDGIVDFGLISRADAEIAEGIIKNAEGKMVEGDKVVYMYNAVDCNSAEKDMFISNLQKEGYEYFSDSTLRVKGTEMKLGMYINMNKNEMVMFGDGEYNGRKYTVVYIGALE